MKRKRSTKLGFTLLEILLGMAIFAIGGVAVLSLFIANANRAERAANETRAVNIAASVRGVLEAALRSPPVQLDGGERRLYPISFPFATLQGDLSPLRSANNDYPQRIDEVENSVTYFFELPDGQFRGTTSNADAFSVLPKQLRNIAGEQVSGLNGQQENRVWFVKPTTFSIAGEDELGGDIDLDDSDAYSFSLFITRSVERSHFETDGENRLLDGLYVVQLRVFKGYDFANQTNVPIQEFTFTLNAQN